ncbi:CD4-like protein isoform X1 [Salmo salar]|uniref:CD4-1-like protein n=2 Tax=Salmo salar TaxID=8030 RepID=B1A013_SALSA|nr:CD4-like protein isoform 1 precursor [Salmo salar]XP_014019014.1 CD4-like protein isoform X1 [Salmo salar]XP_014019021.1 CD4-like protein isoform X1 [Salmo salar]XP_014019030.1 CD4-like protein isoform X1 [Salmo salar]XP_014019036.1 CD4-like protein isoform X1 [Salmo salar]XP_014019043.1 CD4-like protein isoform X1 [Salmo salar]XP_014019051.1 CD4-like protein isoform X1 [Salmo salar]XP_014019061.1 CD4-like protein isoform X1 [Salmo salar]XP_045551571.1 CD4-like protein isoform X1 [Salmo |eukprot:NP_001117083.1 CD4-like protein isoform 1 precursor [Salmo salar]
MKYVSGFLSIIIALFISSTAAGDVLVYGQVGGTVTLPRSKWGSERVLVLWYLGTDTQPLISRNAHGRETIDPQWKDRLSLSKTDFSLIINNIRLEDFKSFKCELKDFRPQPTSVVTTFRLSRVRVQPVSPLLAGKNLNLKCDIEEIVEGTQRRWLSPQKQDPKNDTRVQIKNDGSLTVMSVTGQDHGEWTCVVTYQGRKANANTHVSVIDLSPAHPQPIYTSVSSLSLLHLPCFLSNPPPLSWSDSQEKSIQGGRWTFTPSPAAGSNTRVVQTLVNLSLGPPLAWVVNQKRGLDVSALQRKNLNLSLTKKGVTEGDRGEYTCAVEFQKDDTLKRSIRVEVLQVFSSPAPVAFVGQEVNLTCTLGQPLTSDLKVKWIPPRQSSLLALGSSPHPAHLTIPEARDINGGRWRCELWRNKTKLTSVEITLKIERVPMDVWLLVTICAAAVIFILLLILTVILIRRHRQRVMMPRRGKRRICRCKDPKPKGFYRN